jgi:hypothetical protein
MRMALITVAAALAGCCGGSPLPTTPATSTLPAPAPLRSYALSGVVVERTAMGLQPLAGVKVGLYAWNEDVLVDEALVTSIQTGADGRYTLQADRFQPWVGASKAGYRYYAAFAPFPVDVSFNIELTLSR